MWLSRVFSAVLALPVAFLGAGAEAAEQPLATTMIFDHKHLSNVEDGKEVLYRFKRTVTDANLLGQPFTDDITLKVVASKPTGEKDVDLQIYTGERARDLQKMPNLSINPVFLVYFNQAVNSFSMLAGGQRPYLTRVFSNGFKNKAKVEPVKVDYKGQKIDAYRVSMTPYLGDDNEAKMQGWEGAEYILVLSDKVPGEIVDLIAKYKNKYKGDLHLVERISLDGVTGLEEAK